ncbi:MAG: hypothetical protein K1X64_16185 [Myxococcaceae bacterium]|nr:hypothetical protein [Myxococcaceae bacterium]
MRRFVFVTLCVSSYAAWGQVAPEAEWEALEPPPSSAKVAPAEPLAPPAPPSPPLPASVPPLPNRLRASVRQPIVREDPNRVSVNGAFSLGQWKRAQTLYLGFPFLGIRLGLGLTDHIDLFIGMDSFWGMMNEPRASVRWSVWQGQNWAFAAVLEAGWAFFNTRPAADVHGARWLSGRRNYNIVPGVLLSYQSDAHRATRVFFDVRYQGAIDTEPFQRDPLGGVPPTAMLGNNALFRVGVELPLSPRSSVVFGLNLDAHFRTEDSVMMPGLQVGIVTAL